MTNDEIRDYLYAHADSKYRDFSSALVPESGNMLGVRLPVLRTLAKQISGGSWREYLQDAHSDWFEEIMLQGMVIGAAKMPLNERFEYIRGFLPAINNWSVNDSFCASLRFSKKEPEAVWHFLQPYLISDNCYEQRFAIVMILDYLILPEYLDKIFLAFSEIVSDEYYVQMALAWAVSVCYVKFPEETYSFLETQILQKTVWKKTVRKIMDSYRVSDSDKEKIRKLNSVYCSSRKD